MEADQKKIAAEIADALGETGTRPRRQLARIGALMGGAGPRASPVAPVSVTVWLPSFW